MLITTLNLQNEVGLLRDALFNLEVSKSLKDYGKGEFETFHSISDLNDDKGNKKNKAIQKSFSNINFKAKKQIKSLFSSFYREQSESLIKRS